MLAPHPTLDEISARFQTQKVSRNWLQTTSETLTQRACPTLPAERKPIEATTRIYEERNPKPLKPKDSNGPLWGRLRHLVLDSHIVIAENCFGFNPRGPDKFMFEPDCHFTYVGVYVKNANVFNDAVALFSQHSNIRRVR